MNDKVTLVKPAPAGPSNPNLLADLTPEEREWLKEHMLRQPIPQALPTMLHVEVSRRTFDAVKARPEKLKLIAEGADGVTVIEKPAAAGKARTGVVKWGEPLREEVVGTAAYERLRVQSRQPGWSGGSPSPPDAHWKRTRGWDGELRYVRGTARDNEYVVSNYDIFAVLKEFVDE